MSEILPFLYTIIVGAFLGILYVIFGVLSKIFGKFSIYFFDLLFISVAIISVFFTIEKAYDGNVRLFQIIGFISGFYISKRVLL